MLRPEFLVLLLIYLFTVACFLLWVRHLRVKYSREVVAALINKAAEALAEPYKPSTLPAMTAPTWETTTITTPTLPKIPRGWKKADGKTRHVKSGEVDVMGGSGIIYRKVKAKDLTTAWTDGDIITYRVCKPKKRVTVRKAR